MLKIGYRSALVLSLILSISLITGCRKTEEKINEAPTSSVEQKVIGVMIASYAAQFQSYIMDAMEEEVVNYPDYEFDFVDGQFDSGIQMEQAEYFVAQDVDAIIFISSDSKEAVPIVELIADAGIPVIVCNTKLDDMSKVTAYIGSDSVESGEILMQAMADQLGGKGNIYEMQGYNGHEPQALRHEGIMNILAKYPDIEVIGDDFGQWSTTIAMQKMENILKSGISDEIDGVLCQNDSMALGVMRAYEAQGKLDDVIIGGIDATPEVLNAMKEGKIEFTVFQDAFGQGARAVEVAVKVVKGENIHKEYNIPFVYVGPEDADTYLELYASY